MERIVLEVDDATGKVYQNFSVENKKRFNQAVSIMLKKTINDVGSSSYKKMLDEIGNSAVAEGLTPEMLNEILNADD